MSALAGRYGLDGRHVGGGELERMVQRLGHRGADGHGVWRQGPVGLGHRLRWTTPASCQETLPLVHRHGALARTADARLENREALLAALGLSGAGRHAVPDSALLLAAYAAWGACCPEHLVGDCACARWDGRQQVLLCARDHCGVTPFSYSYRAGQCCACATDIKALLCLPEVPRRLNEVRKARRWLHASIAMWRCGSGVTWIFWCIHTTF
jgi:asparagine synthase (glutamine-hydrolysing)